MSEKELHPSIEQFKQFVKKHPKLIQEVRRGSRTWQEFYEEWFLLGEDDEYWDQYKLDSPHEHKETAEKFVPQLLEFVKKMDPDQIQRHIGNVSQALGAIQGVISQFQPNDPIKRKNNKHASHPFYFRHD